MVTVVRALQFPARLEGEPADRVARMAAAELLAAGCSEESITGGWVEGYDYRPTPKSLAEGWPPPIPVWFYRVEGTRP